MAFEVFDKRAAPLAKAPSVTIQRKGLISINRAAHQMIGSPETVELLYDRDADIVGIRPASDDTPHGYVVRQPGPKKNDNGPVLIAGTAFASYYGIDTTTSRRWTPSLRDGILCIDLKDDGTEVIGNRSMHRGPQHDEEGAQTATRG